MCISVASSAREAACGKEDRMRCCQQQLKIVLTLIAGAKSDFSYLCPNSHSLIFKAYGSTFYIIVH